MLSAARPKPIGSTEMIADALRDAICSGEIAPGAPLKQDEIAAEFSVSHTPVREALKALVSEGLATLHHNRGCFVSGSVERGGARADGIPRRPRTRLGRMGNRSSDRARYRARPPHHVGDRQDQQSRRSAFGSPPNSTPSYIRAPTDRSFSSKSTARATISIAIGCSHGGTRRSRSTPRTNIKKYWTFVLPGTESA